MDIKLDYSDIKFKNDGRLKLIIIVGTRPEIIRLAAVRSSAAVFPDTGIGRSDGERGDRKSGL